MREPREFDRVGLELALMELRDTPSGVSRPFKVVDESYLEEQGELLPIRYVARAPEWRDVVRGADNAVKFIEREATDDLRQKVLDQLIEPIPWKLIVWISPLNPIAWRWRGFTVLMRKHLGIGKTMTS